jgi:hypothetical protein
MRKNVQIARSPATIFEPKDDYKEKDKSILQNTSNMRHTLSPRRVSKRRK